MTEEIHSTQSQHSDPVRESYSAKYLTDGQYDEAIALTKVIEGEINRTGSFREKLQDYAHAFARTEKFDAVKSEVIVRDLFKARTGETMNQMRERLVDRERVLLGDDKTPATISEQQRGKAFSHAREIGVMIASNERIPFYRAYSHQAKQHAADLGVTEMASRKLMQSEFKAIERQELGAWGKELEKAQQRDAPDAHPTQDQAVSRSYSRSR